MREGFYPPPVNLSVISVGGGLGDMIARLVAIKYLIETFNYASLTVYWPDYFPELAEFLLSVPGRLVHKPVREAPYLMPKPYVEFDNDRLTSLHLNLVDHAFLTLMDQLPPTAASRRYIRAENYVGAGLNYLLKDSGLATKPYIVFTTDYTAPARAWPAFAINQLAQKVKDEGLQPVLLGKTGDLFGGTHATSPDGIQLDRFIDLRGRTTLIEALGIIQRAKAVVGIDNGLLHLAACTDTPIVFGLTSLEAEHRIPKREHSNIANYMIGTNAPNLLEQTERISVLEAQVPCAGCQSKGWAMNTDWRKCLFDDYACTLTLTADRFFSSLQRLGVI